MLRREFGLPDTLEPVSVLLIGYSADDAPQFPNRHATTRNPADQTIFYNRLA